MKNKILLPLSILAMSLSMASCGAPSTINLTYGNMMCHDAIQISYDQLVSKMSDEENMLVVTYQGDTSSCGCWRGFDNAIRGLVKETNLLFYKINYKVFSEGKDDFNLIMANDRPALNIINKGKVVDKILYSNKVPQALFKDKAALKKYVYDRCSQPKLYLTPAIASEKYNLDSIDKHIKNKETFIVCYYASGCGDCQYIFPNFFWDYTYNHEIKTPIYMVDLDAKGVKYSDDNLTIKDEVTYQQYKDNHYLSNAINKEYGYNKGYVPTWHYYKNGNLTDAAVFANHNLIKDGDNFKVSEAYYSSKRKESLHYLDNVETPILENLIISNKDVEVYGDFIYWKHESCLTYYQPLLEAFLNKYAI